MTNESKMDAEMKIRCYLEEKGLLKKQADEAGLSMSNFVRSLIFTKEKLIFLSEGTQIAKNLFLIHTDLEYFRSSGGIPEESLRAITASLDDVAAKLNAVSEKLTDIHADDKEGDANE